MGIYGNQYIHTFQQDTNKRTTNTHRGDTTKQITAYTIEAAKLSLQHIIIITAKQAQTCKNK